MGKINTDNYPNRPFSSYQDDDMFILQDNGGETYTTNVGDVKNLADSRIKLEGVQVNGTDLPISGKKVNVDISGKTDLRVIAFPFHDPEPGEPSMGFFKGAYVTYNGKLYEFTQEHQGAWNPSHVREITAAGMFVRAGDGGYNAGRYATTEGHSTRAEGEAAHAEGTGTIANSDNQHAGGRYNVADPDGTYVRIIGNGTADNARSNALTLDWDGNLAVSGDVENGNGEKLSDKADKVTNATSGNLAGLDANGNLTNSGVSPTEDVTVEGNPITFESPFEQDAKSVVVSVKPIQDLHGCDHPWVGGAGKNKFETLATSDTREGVTYTINDDGSFSYSGTPSGQAAFYVGKAYVNSAMGNVIISGLSTTQLAWYYVELYDNTDTKLADFGQNSSADITADLSSYTTASYIKIAVKRAIDGQISGTVYLMVRKSTESATWEPYSNECPISGTTELKIPVTGKNQFDGDWQYGLIDTTTGEVTPHMYVKYHDYIRVKPSTWYTMCAYNMHDLVNPFDIFGYDKNKHYVGLIPINIINNTTALFAEKFQIPSNVAFIRMHIADSTLGTSDKQQLEVGETYTEYEPYVSHTTTIPLPSTLYDADVDVTEGSGENRYGYIASYNGETLPGAWISDRDVYTGSNSPTIGAEVAYELATPTTLSFTPADIELLEGTNVVTTNGEKVAVTYGRSLWQDINDLKTDTEGKLDKSDVADIEGDTASRPYSVNEFMLRADGLYKVTQPIAQNASITASNTTKTTVGEVLTALLNA